MSKLKFSIITALCMVLAAPAHAERTVMTCEGWKDCADLSTVCKKGAYGQVNYPDGSVWGICVI